jgi:hypothetical protein
MGKMTATEPKDKKDLKRARILVSKGHEVVRPSNSRLTGAAGKVTDMGENLGNHSRVNQVSKMEQHYLSWVSRVSQGNNTDRQADWVSQNSSTDRRADQVNQVSGVGNTE